MIKLDAVPRRKIITSIVTVVLYLGILFFSFCIPQKNTPDYTIIPFAFGVNSLIFAGILVFLLVSITITQKRGEKKRKQDSGICRDPSLVFDFSDPESVVETMILYQDYTGEKLSKSLYENNRCNMIVYNMFTKLGWIKLEDDILYVKSGVNNDYLNHFCIRPIENALKAFEEAQKLNDHDWFAQKIPPIPTDFRAEVGEWSGYKLKPIKEYSVDTPHG